MSQHPMMNIAIKTLAKAGEQLLSFEGKKVLAVAKEDSEGDVVTSADLQIEKLILDELSEFFPDHLYICEESGTSGNLSSEYTWILDPIDGTENFFRGFPHFCISLALQYRNETEMAFVYQPKANFMFTAVKGNGAQLNHRRLKTSTRNTLKGGLINLGCQLYVPEVQKLLMHYNSSVKSRQTCAAALDLAYVGAGMFDAMLNTKPLKIWDTVAGRLILLESGGIVVDLLTGGSYVEGDPFIAGNPKLVEEIYKVFHQ